MLLAGILFHVACLALISDCVLQAGKWEEREYRLDELEKHKRVALTRTLPSLDNPLHSGEMLLIYRNNSLALPCLA